MRTKLLLLGLASCAQSPVHGIDVSHHQKEIDWEKVSEECQFAYIKATEGSTWTDPKFNTNLQAAAGTDLYVGCYHYATPGSGLKPYNIRKDAQNEAKHFLNTAAKCLGEGNMRPALDLEYKVGIEKLTNKDLAEWVNHWMDTVEEKIGVKPLLYGYKYPKLAAKGHKNIKNLDLWIADYNPPADIAPWKEFTLWQHSRKGKMKGVHGEKNGYVDLNLFEGNEKSFKEKMLIKD